MTLSYKPDGYNSVSVYLMVDDARGLIAFLRAVFDAETLYESTREDGSLAHAEVRIDDTVLLLSEATPDFPASSTWLHVYVPDVDAAYARALAAGGTSLQEPVQQGDADKRGGFSDPAGNQWWIGTQVEERQ